MKKYMPYNNAKLTGNTYRYVTRDRVFASQSHCVHVYCKVDFIANWIFKAHFLETTPLCQQNTLLADTILEQDMDVKCSAFVHAGYWRQLPITRHFTWTSTVYIRCDVTKPVMSMCIYICVCVWSVLITSRPLTAPYWSVVS